MNIRERNVEIFNDTMDVINKSEMLTNATNPGGEVTKGSQAQEECICRCI